MLKLRLTQGYHKIAVISILPANQQRLEASPRQLAKARGLTPPTSKG